MIFYLPPYREKIQWCKRFYSRCHSNYIKITRTQFCFLLTLSKYNAIFLSQHSWNLLKEGFYCFDLVCWFSYYIQYHKIFLAYVMKNTSQNIHNGEMISLKNFDYIRFYRAIYHIDCIYIIINYILAFT